MARVRVYIEALASAGTFTGTWVEVTKDVKRSGLQAIKEALDGTSFDLGIYRPGSIKLSLDNTKGLYSDIDEPYTIFGTFKRAGAQVRFTYDPADFDYTANTSEAEDILGEETTVFQGLLNDDTAVMNLTDNFIGFTILGRDSVFDRVLTPPAFEIDDPALVSQAIYSALNQLEITSLLDVSVANINPGNDYVITDTSKFTNKTVKESLLILLKNSNSVLYIQNDAIIVKNRVATASPQFYFYGQGSISGPENITNIQDISNGAARVYNFTTWRDTSLTSTDETSVARWGYRKSEFSDESVSDPPTRQSILDAIRIEFGTAKKEFQLTAPLKTDTLALNLLDRVSIDYPELIVSRDDLPIYGVAEYGVAVYPTSILAFSVLPDDHYKIMGRTIDLVKGEIKFKLRQV